MRKITRLACDAFHNSRYFKLSNTEVICGSMILFGNVIAHWRDGMIWISTAGWNTMTTIERLNGIRGVSLTKKKGQLYLNNIPWDGSWVNIYTWGQELTPKKSMFTKKEVL